MSYIPSQYWEERFRRIGHTGDTDQLIYAYDQPQRVAAFTAALERVNCRLEQCGRVLDVGCGSGDIVSHCLACGAPAVTAIDCAAGVIAFVRERFQAQNDRLTVATKAIEDADYPDGSYDLSICFNVLQHVIVESRFRRAVRNVARMSAVGGRILVCERLRKVRWQPGDYVVVRPKQMYVDAFNLEGCLLRAELGLPRLGVRACRAVTRAGSLLLGARNASASAGRPNKSPEISGTSRRLYRLVCQWLLAAAGPLDRSLFPFPSRWTDMSILIFEKQPSTL